MRAKIILLSAAVLFSSLCSASYALGRKDARQKEARYLHNIKKEEVKEQYKRKVFNYNPSGFMTVEEYEALSEYKEPSDMEMPLKPYSSDMKYIPQPVYRLVRYNDPPGSPELNITRNIYKARQYNGQGITSPDFSVMVYPVVYYYPNSASTAADLFVIPLDEKGSSLNKVLNVDFRKRIQEPIVSTDKSIADDSAFRSLTPIDFSADSTKLLVKEKLGSSLDGIWKTNAIVYDFETKTSYNLVELRDAIIYYWKENKNLDLDDCRWDILPLGFLKNDPHRIAALGYAYTGGKPVFLGIWSVDSKGEQSRLISFDIKDVELSINGYKLAQEGVVKVTIVEKEQKAQKKADKMDAKSAKRKEKADLKQMKSEYKAQIKEMDEEFREEQKEYAKLQKIKGTTAFNDSPEKYIDLRIKELTKEIAKEEKALEKEKKRLQIED